MNKNNTVENEVKNFLDGLRPNRTLLEIQHRRLFGLALLACGSFVLLLSLVFPASDRMLWVGGALMILAVGAYKFDRASRDLKKSGR